MSDPAFSRPTDGFDPPTDLPDATRGDRAGPLPFLEMGGVPGFELIRELGRGGTAVVFLARQLGLDRRVALKMVLDGGYASPADRQRFRAEAAAVAAVHHPGIVQVYEVGAFADRPYFALEYCPGGSPILACPVPWWERA